MISPPTIKLSREVRFGLQDPSPATATNSFAGNPTLEGLAPFITLTVTVSGPLDPSTGMLVNIKVIDSLVREHAVEKIRHAAKTSPLALGGLVKELVDVVSQRLGTPARQIVQISLALSPYLRIWAIKEELPMVRLSQKFEFSAAHRLHAAGLSDAENRDIFGRCNNPNGHGHNYELEVTVAGTPDPATGIILPIATLQKLVNERLIDVFDHKHLNLDCADFAPNKVGGGLNPTVENIAQVLFKRLQPAIPTPARLASIKLWETPKTMCEYSE